MHIREFVFVDELLSLLKEIAATGGMCYTIYLVHSELIHHFVNLGRRLVPAMNLDLAFVVWSLVLTPLIFAISVFFFVMLERPCMNPTWPSLLAAKVRARAR